MLNTINSNYSFNEDIIFVAPAEQTPLKKTFIKQIALQSLKELAVSLAFVSISCCFIAAPAIPALVLVTISIVAINTLLRCLLTYFLYQEKLAERANPDYQQDIATKFLIGLLQFSSPVLFTILDTTTRDVLIHEAGHACAVHALYKNAHTRIEIFPFKGGVTEYVTRGLSSLGERIGPNASELIVSAAGPAAAVLTATGLLAAAHLVKDKHPNLRRYLTVMAVTSIAQHVLYALSAFGQKVIERRASHDFVALWAGGIHPIVSIIAMVALPLLVQGTFLAVEIYRQRRAESALLASV